MTEKRSSVARFSAFLGGAALAALLLGPLAIQGGVVSGFVGFRVFGIGALLGVLALVMGVIALFATRRGPRRAARGQAWTGTLIGLGVVVAIAVLAGPSRDYPIINDITTDVGDPPKFEVAESDPSNRGRDLAYPAEFAAVQRKGYPDLRPIAVTDPPEVAFQRALTTASALGWTVTASDASRGRIEATETTEVFRFVDDIVVRIRPTPTGSLIDVRSKSRDGRGDMGANAQRIRTFSASLTESDLSAVSTGR